MEVKLVAVGQFIDPCAVVGCPNTATHECTTGTDVDPVSGEVIQVKPVRLCEECFMEHEADPEAVQALSEGL